MLWTFKRGTQRLSLEAGHDAATGLYLMSLHHPSGTVTTEQFLSHQLFMTYLHTTEDNLRTYQWTRIRWDNETSVNGSSTIVTSDVGHGPSVSRPSAEPYAVYGTIDAALRTLGDFEGNDGNEQRDSQPVARATGQVVATYELERPARCPHCSEALNVLHVLKLTRTRVQFTSTLPRGGKVIVCPSCDRIVSAAVSGLI